MTDSPINTGGSNAQQSTQTGVDFFESFHSAGTVVEDTAPGAAAGETPSSQEAPTETGIETPQTPTGVDQSAQSTQNNVTPEESLREEINRMAAIMASHGISYGVPTPEMVANTQGQHAVESPAQTTPTVPPQQTAPQQGQMPTSVAWSESVQISDDDFNASLESKEAFERILTTVRNQTIEKIFQSLPQVTTSMINSQIYFSRLSDEFYRANEDLAGFRPFVGAVANEVASRNPGYNPKQVLDATAIEVRKRLHLKTQAQTSTQVQPGPGLPNPTTRQKSVKAELTGLAKELNELMEV